MLLFSVEKAAQTLGGKDIFTGVSFEVHCGEKLAIVGPNGVGKSSLLRIIAGLDQPCEGRIKCYAPINCGLLSEHFDVKESYTIGETLERSVPEDGLHRSVGETLSKFQFTGREGQRVANLSGGEKTRLQLAHLWLTGAHLLLLDEPTNHLDTVSLDCLEGFIYDSPDTIILVSHDRYFMDRTVTRVLELRPDGMNSYPGNYSAYHKARIDKLSQDKKTYLDQEKQARKLDEAIREQKNWAGQAHDRAARKAIEVGSQKAGKVYYRNKAKKLDRRVKNNIKRLEHLEKERIARPPTTRIMDLAFSGGTRAKNGILQAEGLKKAFGRRVLFADCKVSLQYGEKAGLVGMNGSGKTTLLRIIAGRESLDAGELWLSPSLRLGYLDQEMQNLDKNRSVLEEVVSVCADRGRVRNLLADLLLTGQDVFKSCSVLSMGERVRVALAKLLLGTFDLLLMDEPTNYLDLESREKLEEALEAFSGSLIIVSHDRYLMERVVETVWSIEDSHIRTYPGGYHEYVEKRFCSGEKRQERQDDRLELEIKKARIISELSVIDALRNQDDYLRLEQEYFQVIHQLREL